MTNPQALTSLDLAEIPGRCVEEYVDPTMAHRLADDEPGLEVVKMVEETS
jgi:hypothetical protein